MHLYLSIPELCHFACIIGGSHQAFVTTYQGRSSFGLHRFKCPGFHRLQIPTWTYFTCSGLPQSEIYLRTSRSATVIHIQVGTQLVPQMDLVKARFPSIICNSLETGLWSMDGHISQNYYGYLVSVGVGHGRICVLFSIFTMFAELHHSPPNHGRRYAGQQIQQFSHGRFGHSGDGSRKRNVLKAD